jgi:hypothetical protein
VHATGGPLNVLYVLWAAGMVSAIVTATSVATWRWRRRRSLDRWAENAGLTRVTRVTGVHYLLGHAQTNLYRGPKLHAATFGACRLGSNIGDVRSHFTVFTAPVDLGPVPFLVRRRRRWLADGGNAAAEWFGDWRVHEFESAAFDGLYQMLVPAWSDGLEVRQLFTPQREEALIAAAENPFAHVAEYDGRSLLVAAAETASAATADALLAAARAMFEALSADLPHAATPHA